jgi:hypothetical protein
MGGFESQSEYCKLTRHHRAVTFDGYNVTRLQYIIPHKKLLYSVMDVLKEKYIIRKYTHDFVHDKETLILDPTYAYGEANQYPKFFDRINQILSS